MKDIIKSFLMGVGAASGFFMAIHFTADDELAVEAEQAGYVAGLIDGAKEQALTGGCNWRSQFRDMPKAGTM